MNRYDSKEIVSEIELMKTEFNFPNISSPKDINDIIHSINNDNLLNISVEDLLVYSTKLISYSLYLVHETNRIKAKIDWLESNIKHIVGKELANSRGFTFEEKNTDIRSNHELADKLEEQKLVESAKYEVMKNLPFKIQALADQLNMIIRERNNFNKRTHQ